MEEKHPPDSTNFGPALAKIRKRRLFLWGVILIYMPSMWTTLHLTQSFNATAIVFVLWLLLLCIVATVAALARCPGCGNYFHMHGMTLLYLRKCLHCGLHITADKKLIK